MGAAAESWTAASLGVDWHRASVGPGARWEVTRAAGGGWGTAVLLRRARAPTWSKFSHAKGEGAGGVHLTSQIRKRTENTLSAGCESSVSPSLLSVLSLLPTVLPRRKVKKCTETEVISRLQA